MSEETELLPSASALFTALESSSRDYNLKRIHEAYDFAYKAHEHQTRKSGEPYIVHPTSVAMILMDFDCDTDTIIAALFHDIIEDTPYTYDDIKKKFGENVAELVEGVTKLDKIKYSSQEEQQLETLRKMLLAMTKDIRVILIKLADRLHNLRTLDSMPEQKQRTIALESIEVYAPLAHRLGIQSIKSEIEDIAVRYLDPIGYNEIVNDLEKLDTDKNFFSSIKEMIEKKLKEENIKATVDGRVKHIYSIYRKMFTQNKDFNEIYDLYAFRVIVEKVSDCYNVLGHIHDLFQAIPGRLKDYIAVPKPNMYQSLHTTVSYNGHFFEVQIRTEEMHRIAELGIAAHWKYKSGGISDSSADEKLAWVRKLLEVQTDVSEPDDFMKTFKIDLFSDQVFVSTPKGDIIKLPADSNIIDFAYSIHSEVGNKMTGGKINGRISELSTTLHNGDVVEIITSQSSPGPSRDWLNLAQTNEAKAKIRQWFKREKRDENIQEGKTNLERELRRINIYTVNIDKNTFFLPIMNRYGMTDIDDFYAAIGYGGISISKILPKLKEDYTKLQKQNEKPKTVEVNTKRKSINGVIVDDIDNCLVHLAGCCSPLPGDEIIGYITRGNGVAIHKTDCINMQNADGNRIIRVHWDGTPSDYFATTVRVTALQRIDLIADITMALASMRIVMHSISTHDLGDGRIDVFLNIDVLDLAHLDTVMKRINKINSVTTVERAPEKGMKK
jgi:GTP pyrophosphokinase